MTESTEKYTAIQLDAEAERRWDQASFHFLSEGEVRGQVLNLRAGSVVRRTPFELGTLLTGIAGSVRVDARDRSFDLRPLAQLYLAPFVEYTLTAAEDASCSVLTFPLAGSGTSTESR